MITAAIIAAMIARMDAEPTKQHSRRVLRFLDEVNKIYKKNVCEKMACYCYSQCSFYFSIIVEKNSYLSLMCFYDIQS